MLSVAIINYETPDLTASCAASVQACAPTEPHELLIVDNGSSAETLMTLRALPDVRLVEVGANRGFAAGVNIAMHETSGDVVVILNSDTEVTPGALDALAAAAREPDVALAAPLLIGRDGKLQISAHYRFPNLWTLFVTLCSPLAALLSRVDGYLPRSSVMRVADHRAGRTPAHVMGAVMAISRTATKRVGTFDERYFLYLEETDWQERAATCGYRMSLVSAVTVRHLHRGGAVAVAAPPRAYLDSALLYFGRRGHRVAVVRAVSILALSINAVTLRTLQVILPPGGEARHVVDESLPDVRRSVRYVLGTGFLSQPHF